jgi:hypothetical protein
VPVASDVSGWSCCRAHGLSSMDDEAAMASRGVDGNAAQRTVARR